MIDDYAPRMDGLRQDVHVPLSDQQMPIPASVRVVCYNPVRIPLNGLLVWRAIMVDETGKHWLCAGQVSHNNMRNVAPEGYEVLELPAEDHPDWIFPGLLPD